MAAQLIGLRCVHLEKHAASHGPGASRARDEHSGRQWSAALRPPGIHADHWVTPYLLRVRSSVDQLRAGPKLAVTLPAEAEEAVSVGEYQKAVLGRCKTEEIELLIELRDAR